MAGMNEPESQHSMTKPDGDQDRKAGEVTGVTQGALRGLGKIIPGFGELVKGLEESEAFQKRLRAADAEVERQLRKAPPLKIVEGTRRSIIPPETTMKVSRTTTREGAAPQPPRREVTTDIFDEGDCLKVIADMPGVDEMKIKAEVRDNLLILTAQATGQEYHEEVELPCSVRGESNFACRNGIVQVTLEKEQL